MSDSLQSYGLQPAWLLCPRDSPGKNTQVSCQFLLQGIFLTRGLNPGLLHCRQILYQLSHQGSFFKKSKEANKKYRKFFRRKEKLCILAALMATFFLLFRCEDSPFSLHRTLQVLQQPLLKAMPVLTLLNVVVYHGFDSK